MKKIPTLYERDENDRKHVIPGQVTEGCEWVLRGEGQATRKYDGTCTMLDDDGKWWARREVKPGKDAPPGWREVDHDDVTGKRVGWEPIEQTGWTKFHAEALAGWSWDAGTYELCGPRVNGNPEGLADHVLIPHGRYPLDVPRDFDGLSGYLLDHTFEGIVWHHPDGRRAKLKRRDLRR